MKKQILSQSQQSQHRHQQRHHDQNRRRPMRTATALVTCDDGNKMKSRRRSILLQQPSQSSSMLLLVVISISACAFCCCCLQLQQTSQPFVHAFQLLSTSTVRRRRTPPSLHSFSETKISLIRRNMVAQITSSSSSSSSSVGPQNSESSYNTQQHNTHDDDHHDARQLLKQRLPEIQRSSTTSSSSSSTNKVDSNEERRTHFRRHHHGAEEQSMTRLEIEFRDLLEGIIYTDEEVNTVVNPRLRTVLEGITASYHDPAVYRAFEVLYCDAGPLRIAGRIMYSKLRIAIERSTAKQHEQFKSVMDTTSLTRDEIKSCWSTYLKWIQFYEYEDHQPQNTDNHHHHEDGTISVWAVQKLIEDGSTSMILKNLNSLSVDEAMEKINPHGHDSLPFDQLIRNVFHARALSAAKPGHQNMLNEVFEIDMDDEREMEALLSSSSSSSSWPSKSKCKYNRRYDEMLEQFDEWKEFIMPSSSGNGDDHDPDTVNSNKERKQQRRMDIMRGCFVGSENPKVVEALRVIYVDNAALRVSGDWIFKTVSVLINRQQQQERKRHQQRP